MKTLLRPTVLKIILALFLFTAFSWLWRMYIRSTVSDTFPLGFPLQFFLAWGPCQAGQKCSEFNELYLTLDIVFWYIVGAIPALRLQKKNRSSFCPRCIKLIITGTNGKNWNKQNNIVFYEMEAK